MPTVTFPVSTSTGVNHLCVWCRKGHKLLEPHSFASLEGGAILLDPDDRESGGPSDDLEGYLSITWHGAHSSEAGIGEHPDVYVHLPIKSDVIGGQVSLEFCSAACLRAFLSHCVDELERRMSEQ